MIAIRSIETVKCRPKPLRYIARDPEIIESIIRKNIIKQEINRTRHKKKLCRNAKNYHADSGPLATRPCGKLYEVFLHDQKKTFASARMPCFHGTRCETPLAPLKSSRCSRYHSKLCTSASLLEYFGLNPNIRSAFSMDTKLSFDAVS